MFDEKGDYKLCGTYPLLLFPHITEQISGGMDLLAKSPRQVSLLLLFCISLILCSATLFSLFLDYPRQRTRAVYQQLSLLSILTRTIWSPATSSRR